MSQPAPLARSQVAEGKRGAPRPAFWVCRVSPALFCSLTERKEAGACGVGGLTREKHAAVGQVTGPLNMSPAQPGLSDGDQPLGPLLGSVGDLKKTGLWAGEGYLHSSSPLLCKPSLSVAALTNVALICSQSRAEDVGACSQTPSGDLIYSWQQPAQLRLSNFPSLFLPSLRVFFPSVIYLAVT